MTPCERRGYKVGDKFEVFRKTAFFKAGTIVILYHDDGSRNPYFYNDEIAALHDGDKYWPVGLSCVKPMNEEPNA